MHGLRRLDAVRQPGRAAGLRPPVGPEDHPGAVHGPGDRTAGRAPGRPAGQPRRPGRYRAVPRRVGRLQPRPEGGLRIQHHRVRPARRGRQRARAALRPVLLRRRAARLHPGEPGRRAGPHRPGQGLRRRLRAPVRLAAAVHDHRGRRQGHGLHPGGARASGRSATWVTPTAPTWARSTPRCSAAGYGGWCSTAPSTRRAPGTPTTSPRTTRSSPGSRPSSPGSPRTRATYRLGTTRAQVQQAWYRARAELTAHPVDGPSGPMIGPDEFDDTMLQGGYSNTLWPGLAAALAAYLHTGSTRGSDQRVHARSAGRTRTSSPSTTRSSAATSTGRATGPNGTPTPGGSTGPRRSRPGTTRGSTRPAPSGRCTARRSRWPSTARACRPS